MELVEIGRISSKHVRVTVASPKGAQTPKSVASTPPIAGAHLVTAMNNHVSDPADDTPKQNFCKDEIDADNVEEMDTREGDLWHNPYDPCQWLGLIRLQLMITNGSSSEITSSHMLTVEYLKTSAVVLIEVVIVK